MTTATFLSKAQLTTDAIFRTWGKGLSDAIQAVGLVKTADTGQIDWLTVLAPTTPSQIRGYEIFRFNDALQATSPIFIKISYGSGGYGVSATSCPYIKTAVGKGSDGSGNLTDILHIERDTYTNGSSNSTDYASYVSSGDGSMLVFTLWPMSPIDTHGYRFVLERSRDAIGLPTGLATMCYRVTGSVMSAGTGTKLEVVDYTTMQSNTLNRGAVHTGYEIDIAKTINNGTSTVMFKPYVVTPNRVKWTPKGFVAYAYADAGVLQIVNLDGADYITLSAQAGEYADAGMQQYCCLALAYY